MTQDDCCLFVFFLLFISFVNQDVSGRLVPTTVIETYHGSHQDSALDRAVLDSTGHLQSLSTSTQVNALQVSQRELGITSLHGIALGQNLLECAETR